MSEGNILFFSGGTAMRATAGELASFTADTVHIVTPFDSGGSSAAIRKAFAMPAVGDLRARLLAVAARDCTCVASICELLGYRLPFFSSGRDAEEEFQQLCAGRHPLMTSLPKDVLRGITEWLGVFHQAMPDDFPLPGASVGNLFITGGYLAKERRLGLVIRNFSKLIKARAVVLPAVHSCDLHLAVRLDSGEIIVGQHLFTGKGCGCIESRIADIWLTKSLDSRQKARVASPVGIRRLVSRAGLICYPVGSFYSSIIANLLLTGTGRAIAANPCPKLFIPNLGHDPELCGHSLEAQVERILEVVGREVGGPLPPERAVSVILVDEESDYPGGLPESYLRKKRISLLKRRLMTESSAPLADPVLLSEAIYNLRFGGKLALKLP